MIKHTVILFSSNGNNIGKTTTANRLEEFLGNKYTITGANKDTSINIFNNSFANPIREITKSLYGILFNDDKSWSFEELYTQDYKNVPLSVIFSEKKFEDYPELEEQSIRGLVNLLSDQLTVITNENLWAGYARRDIIFKSITQNKIGANCIFIYDDLRRPLEYNYLKDNLDSNVYNTITVHLDKEGNKSQVNTSYEGQLKDFNFDIKFTFKEDYNNLEDLFTLITNKIEI